VRVLAGFAAVPEKPFDVLPVGDEGEQAHATAAAGQVPTSAPRLRPRNGHIEQRVPIQGSYNLLYVGAISSIDPAAP
jgi:hypothetical protein